MKNNLDSEKTLEIIEGMRFSKIGKDKKWEKITKKIKNKQSLSLRETEYFTNIARIYKTSKITNKSKIYHHKLSEEDEKPPCDICGEKSLYYCNMNDGYFCTIHVVGHDKNEI